MTSTQGLVPGGAAPAAVSGAAEARSGGSGVAASRTSAGSLTHTQPGTEASPWPVPITGRWVELPDKEPLAWRDFWAHSPAGVSPVGVLLAYFLLMGTLIALSTLFGQTDYRGGAAEPAGSDPFGAVDAPATPDAGNPFGDDGAGPPAAPPDAGPPADAGDPFLAARDVLGPGSECRINLRGHPALLDCFQHATEPLDFLKNVPGLVGDLVRE